MNSRYFSFGALTARYTGELSLLDGTLLRRFAAEGGEPRFTVTLESGCAVPVSGRLLHSHPGITVLRTDGGWHCRYFAQYGAETREYAALTYSDDRADLCVTEACKNPPLCVESCTAFEHLSICAGALPLHASHILTSGGSVLFSAPSGTGKSTQAALWEKHRGAEVVNGDKALVLRAETGFTAAGLPYAGTSGICKNIAAPLRAVVFLAQGSENTLTRLKSARAVVKLASGAIRLPWHTEDAERILALAEAIAAEVPIYHFSCLPDKSAVDCLDSALAAV